MFLMIPVLGYCLFFVISMVFVDTRGEHSFISSVVKNYNIELKKEIKDNDLKNKE